MTGDPKHRPSCVNVKVLPQERGQQKSGMVHSPASPIQTVSLSGAVLREGACVSWACHPLTTCQLTGTVSSWNHTNSLFCCCLIINHLNEHVNNCAHLYPHPERSQVILLHTIAHGWATWQTSLGSQSECKQDEFAFTHHCHLCPAWFVKLMEGHAVLKEIKEKKLYSWCKWSVVIKTVLLWLLHVSVAVPWYTTCISPRNGVLVCSGSSCTETLQ